MITYSDDGNLAVINGLSFRRDSKTGYFLSSKPIGERRKRLHRYVWENEHGEIPDGYEVHHIDHDKTNNEISNLQLLTISDHHKHHHETMTDEQRQALRDNIIKNGVPAARYWHGTEEGRKWHSEHAKVAMKKRKKMPYICDYCGSRFETINIYKNGEHHFCSNKCKSSYRRKSGVDNEKRQCKKCGRTFISNKYSTKKYCEEHKGGKG